MMLYCCTYMTTVGIKELTMAYCILTRPIGYFDFIIHVELHMLSIYAWLLKK